MLTPDDREMIRQAAVQLRTVIFVYVKADGQVDQRECEPYSYRMKSGGECLYGHDRMREDSRSFTTDRMSSVQMTDTAFMPRWPVEIF